MYKGKMRTMILGLSAAVGIAGAILTRADVPPANTNTTVSPAKPGDWPQWRGPNRDDISTETGLLKQWPKGGPPLAWVAKGLGEGYSGVSVAGGRIYTMGVSNANTSIIALDLSGKRLWATKIGTGQVGNRPGPRATPTVDGDRVYSMDEMGNLACLQAAEGKLIWHISEPRDLGGKVMSGWGFAESVLVDGEHLVCTPGGSKGSLAALDKMTGKVIWRSAALTDRTAYCSLVPAEIGGVHQYVVMTEGHVAGIAADGRLLWQADRPGKTAVIPTPIVHDDLVFVTSGYGVGCNCFQVTGSNGSFKARQIYANGDLVVHHGGVVLVGDYIYGVTDNRLLVCMELKTGHVVWTDKSVWSQRKYGDKGSLTFADGNLYLRAEGGLNAAPSAIALIEATPKGYHELGRFEQPDRSDQLSWSHPVVAGGKLYLRDQDALLCYDIKAK